MPFYEYECGNCRFYVEVLQKISERPLKKCPSCGKSALKKLLSAPVFRLKGSGWYETDFKSDKEGKRNLAGADKDEKDTPKPKEGDKQADAKTEAKADDKSDSKPAAEPKPAVDPAKAAPGSGKKAKSKGAVTGKSAGLRRSASSRSKSSSKRRRGR